MVLPRLFAGDEVLGFVARHRRADIDAAMTRFDLAGLQPHVLPLPRPILYDAWHYLAGPPLTLGTPALASADVVHAPSVAVPPRGRAPLVVTVHDAAPELFPDAFPRRGLRFHRAGLAAAARRADLVVTVSQAAADEIAGHSAIRPERIRVVYNGVDPVTVPDERRQSVIRAAGLADRPYVLWVGSLEPRKRLGTLVAAMATLHRRGLRARLVLVGYEGWLGKGLVAAADRSELGADLIERGPVPDEELWALYAGAAVFAFPSVHEGFGLPVLEAMTQGAPVVCSDLAVFREVAGDAAVRVATGDVGAWVDAIGGLLADPEAARRFGEAGRAYAALWTVERSVGNTRAVYEEVLGRGR